MIKLTRLDGELFILNADLIRYVEARPDTFITLTTGERVVVAETMDEVLLRAITYQQTKHLIPAARASGSRHSDSTGHEHRHRRQTAINRVSTETMRRTRRTAASMD